MMFGKADTLVLVVEPVDLKLAVRVIGIQVSPKHLFSIVVIFLHIRPQIKIRDFSIDRVENIPFP
jgi:hypothetical protein